MIFKKAALTHFTVLCARFAMRHCVFATGDIDFDVLMTDFALLKINFEALKVNFAPLMMHFIQINLKLISIKAEVRTLRFKKTQVNIVKSMLSFINMAINVNGLKVLTRITNKGAIFNPDSYRDQCLTFLEEK